APLHDTTDRTTRFKNVSHDKCGTFAHHPAFFEWGVRKQARSYGDALTSESGICADQVLQGRARAAKNHAEIRLCTFGKLQLQSASSQHCDESWRAKLLQNLYGGNIE